MRVMLGLPLGNPYKWESAEIALGYLAAVLRERGHEVRLMKGMRLMPAEVYAEELKKFAPHIVGLRFMSPSIWAIKDTAKLIKELDPSITVIVGGPHPTGEPEHTLTEIPDIDYAFVGEAEVSLPAFVEQLERFGPERMAREDLSKIPAIAWRQNGTVRVNPIQRVQNLDEIPFPAWDLIDPRTLPNKSVWGPCRRPPIAPIVMTRGCPYHCTFCSPVNGRAVRFRTPDNVVREMTLLYRDYGVREFDIYDSNCTHSKAFLMEVCNKMMAANLDVVWTCGNGVRLNSLDEELLNTMKKAGCYCVAVGIESGSPEVLKRIKKGVTVKMVREKTNLIKRCGIATLGYFIIGFPGETREQIMQTIELSMDLPLTRASCYIFNPLPGSELYNELKAQGKLEGTDLSKIAYANSRNTFSEVSPKELVRLARKAFLRFYLRPMVLFRLLRETRLMPLIHSAFTAFLIRFGGQFDRKHERAAAKYKSVAAGSRHQ